MKPMFLFEFSGGDSRPTGNISRNWALCKHGELTGSTSTTNLSTNTVISRRGNLFVDCIANRDDSARFQSCILHLLGLKLGRGPEALQGKFYWQSVNISKLQNASAQDKTSFKHQKLQDIMCFLQKWPQVVNWPVSLICRICCGIWVDVCGILVDDGGLFHFQPTFESSQFEWFCFISNFETFSPARLSWGTNMPSIQERQKEFP